MRRSPGLLTLEKRRLRGSIMIAYSFLVRGTEGHAGRLFSLAAVTGPEGTVWNCIKGGSGWTSGKGPSLEGC